MNDLDRINNQLNTLNLIEYLEGKIEKTDKTKTLRWIHETVSELYYFNESVVKELNLQELRNHDLERLLLEFNKIKEELDNVKNFSK